MKIKNCIFLLVFLLILSAKSVTAQSWLNKALKTLDKIEKGIDEALQDDSKQTQNNANATNEEVSDNTPQSQYHFVEAFKNIPTYTSDFHVPIKFISCIRNGDDVTVEFEMGNNTDTDLEMYRFGAGKKLAGQTDITTIADDTGHNHAMHSATIGGTTEILYSGGSISTFRMTKGIRAKCSIVAKGIPNSARSLQLFKIAFDNGMGGGYTVRYFTFKNVPILTYADIARLEEEYKQKEFQKLVAKANAGDANAQCLVANAYYNNGDFAKAVDYYTRSADQGNALAQGYLAYVSLSGIKDYLEIDHSKALVYAQKSKDQGNELGYYILGVIYAGGAGVDKDEEKAIEYLTYAANKNNANAQECLGSLYRNNDKNLSAYWYKKAADNEALSAFYVTGDNYLYGWGIEKNEAKALEYFLKGVENNNKECLFGAGLMYRRGRGIPHNLPKAKELLIKSAELGYIEGFRELGYYYRFNEEDYPLALNFLNLAVEQGDYGCLYYLAEMYEKGMGTLKNPAKAKELYIKSATNGSGDKDSQYRLGLMTKESNDLKVAFDWFSKSAEAGQSDAQYEVGLMYFYAKGTAKNNKKAAENIEKAYKAGNKEAEKVWNNLQLWKYL